MKFIREYRSWHSMRQRCLNPMDISFERYGAAGIRICKRWLNSFDNFLKDMGRRPKNRTLDRIDPDGHYTPKNCRWATPKQQAANKSARPRLVRAAVSPPGLDKPMQKTVSMPADLQGEAEQLYGPKLNWSRYLRGLIRKDLETAA